LGHKIQQVPLANETNSNEACPHTVAGTKHALVGRGGQPSCRTSLSGTFEQLTPRDLSGHSVSLKTKLNALSDEPNLTLFAGPGKTEASTRDQHLLPLV
jgi:hypothetical protein